jgi:hypothetical protein
MSSRGHLLRHPGRGDVLDLRLREWLHELSGLQRLRTMLPRGVLLPLLLRGPACGLTFT